MTVHEIETALTRIRKNPHAIEKYSKEDLYDVLEFLRTKINKAIETHTNIWVANSKLKEFKKANKNHTLQTYVERGLKYNVDKKEYELIEKRYNQLCEPTEINLENPMHIFAQHKYKPLLEKWTNYLKHKDCEHWSENDFRELLDVQNVLIEYKLQHIPALPLKECTPDEIELNKKELQVLKDSYITKFVNRENTDGIKQIDFNTNNAAKVCFLYEIGFIDLLISKGFTNNKVAEFLEYLTKEPISTGSANMALSRIINEGLLNKYEVEIATLKLIFNLVRSE